MSLVIGIDIGTTGCKAAVFTEDGCIAGEAYFELPLIVKSDCVIEQDADCWWTVAKTAVQSALSAPGVSGRDVGSICISSQGISFVPVDRRCTPLSNAISWLDGRAKNQLGEILEHLDAENLHKITGLRLGAVYVLPKLLWMRQNTTDAYKNAYKFLMAHDFIVAKLTGRFLTDHTMAGGTMLYDICRNEWSVSIIDAMGLDAGQLPEIRWSGEEAGTILPNVSAELGIAKSALVRVGAQDQKASALGVGLEKDCAVISLGTAGAAEFLTDTPSLDKAMRIPCFAYARRGHWVLEAVVPAAGASLKWFRNTLFPDSSYEELDLLCEASSMGSNGVFFHPHLAGAGSPFWDQEARGMLCGLSISTSGADMARSVLEGISFLLKANFLEAQRLGVNIKRAKVYGGGARSKVWCGILADVLGIDIACYSSPGVASLGAGMLAAYGVEPADESFGKQLLQNNMRIEPDATRADCYGGIYEKYMAVERWS